MKLAVLVTNTDDSAFAQARPKDDAKFDALIRSARSDWTTDPYWACRNEFPTDISAFDGVIITGSPASVSATNPWIEALQAVIRQVIDDRQPLFGACFGHQMIAKTLGAPIIRNPGGWVHGAIRVERVATKPWSGKAPEYTLYGSHIEQVGAAVPGATLLFSSDGCPIAGFSIGDHVFTIQHHPEMTHEFITDLVEEYQSEVGQDVTTRARASLANRADQRAFAEEITAFFELASGAGV